MADDRKTGIVRRFDVKLGSSFITQNDGGEDLFVHHSVIKTAGFRSLGEGEPVEYVVQLGSECRSKAGDVTGPNRADAVGSSRSRGGGGGGGYGGGGGGYGGGVDSSVSGGGECFKCGETGHEAKDCEGVGPNVGVHGGCYLCGVHGHFARHCKTVSKPYIWE